MQKIKAAIIGLGPHGQRLVKVLSRIKDVELCGLIDRNPASMDAVDASAEIKYTDTSTFYRNNKAELVLIATNGPSHAGLALEAMENGARYVLVEKPMACSVEECNRMLDASVARNVRLAVNKKNRHDEVLKYIKSQLDSGAWGQLRYISFQIPGIGLGCLGTHWFDMANFLFGKNPLRVSAWVDEAIGKNPRGEQFSDPGGLVVLDYGKLQRATLAQIEDGAGPMSMEIHSTAARIFFDPKNKILDIRARDLSIKPGPGRPAVYNKIEVPETMPLNGDMIDQMEAVVRELLGDAPMLTDASFGKSAVEILAAAHISQDKGNVPIELPLQNESDIKKYLPVT